MPKDTQKIKEQINTILLGICGCTPRKLSTDEMKKTHTEFTERLYSLFHTQQTKQLRELREKIEYDDSIYEPVKGRVLSLIDQIGKED